MADPAPEPLPPPAESKEAAPAAKQQRRGLIARVWGSVFGSGKEDYEKRLQYLSKEEATVHARMRRRNQASRRLVRNLVLLSVLAEVGAIVYAIVATRSSDLTWQMRAVRVSPMFVLPFVTSILYSSLISFTRMLERKDQKTLENLRAERKAKIDELKERTNYYLTQQLIQKYDLDPAAKAAAAAVLASKLGAESGITVHVGEEKSGAAETGSNDVNTGKTAGLRNRKHPHQTNSSPRSTTVRDSAENVFSEAAANGVGVSSQPQKVVEHYHGSGVNDGGWIARIAALIVGEDPSQSYALICGNCHRHNGLARKEDFPLVTYYCPHCHALNASRQSSETVPESGSHQTIPSRIAAALVDNESATNAVVAVSEAASLQELPVDSNENSRTEES